MTPARRPAPAAGAGRGGDLIRAAFSECNATEIDAKVLPQLLPRGYEAARFAARVWLPIIGNFMVAL